VVVWRVHVRSKQEANARRVLRRLTVALGQRVEETSVERYWKIPEQYVLLFTTPLHQATPPEAVFQTMLAARRIGSGWIVGGPHGSDDEGWTFEMVCATNANGRFSVPGVEWAHVALTTPSEHTECGQPTDQ
jgi:hypothetical protein